MALLGARRSSDGPGGPDLVPTAPDWPVWAGLMVTTHFDLVSGPFWGPRGPKRDRFCPKCPFWGPWRSSGGPEGPDSSSHFGNYCQFFLRYAYSTADITDCHRLYGGFWLLGAFSVLSRLNCSKAVSELNGLDWDGWTSALLIIVS